MPWFHQWSDSIKKRACRYLLQRYLGQFLEEKLTLDQLTVDLYNGTGSVSGVVLDVQALNELGEQENLPIEFVDGYISEMTVSIPLSQLFTESSYIEVSGLILTVQPKKRAYDGGSMFESMWNSMSNSMQIAAECLQQTVDEKEAENANLMEGLEHFANAIDSVLTRVKIKLVNTILRLEHLPKQGQNGIAIEIRINNIDYCDEACADPIYSESSPQATYQSSTFSIKKFHCESIHFFTDEFPAAGRTFSRSIILKKDSERSHIKSNSEPILFGKLFGRQEIRLKLKQDDSVLGPKVDIGMSLGSLTLFLSPRQMHLIVELIHSLGSPHLQDTSNVEPKSFSQKPMNLCDYEKVEQELQENISCPPIDNKFKEKLNHGWSSPSFEENEEEFLPMKGNVGVTDSVLSETAMDSSVTSTFTSATMNSKCSSSSFDNSSSWGSKRKGSKKCFSNVGDGDFSGEMTGFIIRIASLSAIVLHGDVLLFDADSSSLTPMSISIMKNLSSIFFKNLEVYDTLGYGNKDFKQVKDLLSSSCSQCHIRLISTAITIEGSEKGNHYSRSLSVLLTTASFQATECIYDEKSAENNDVPHFVELLNFMRVNEDTIKPHFPLSGLPEIKLHLEQIKKYRSSNPNACVKADLSLSIAMQQCWSEIDLSIIDRISSIIHSELLCHTINISKESSNEQSSFSKAVETSSLADIKFDFKLSTPFLVIKFRFPIPDLRPVHDRERNPRWKRSVRKDILYFNLIEPSVRSESNNRTFLQSYKIYFSEILALFQEGGTSIPVPFARATHDKDGNKPSKIGHCIGLPCISFRICPKETVTELEEAVDDGHDISQSCYIDSTPKQPSPFSLKHVVHGNNQATANSESGSTSSDAYGEELIVPAEKQDMVDFINFATRTARIQVDVSLPFVAVHFPSKHFYEVIYNRLNSDLSLWQSSSYKTYSSTTGNNSNFEDYFRHPFFPAFTMCKSGLMYDSESDNDESGFDMYVKAKSKQKNIVKLNGQSKYSLNIAVSQGFLNICTNLKDSSGNSISEQHGELQINVEEGNVFVVNHFKGVPQQNYVCLLVNEAALYFKDVQKNELSTSSPLFSPSVSPSNLSATIYYQHTAVSNKPLPSDNSKNMLRAAIHTEVNENKVKIIKVSCGLQSATLQHKVCLPQHAWLTQLMDFFDVIDYPVRGYDSPQVITELHQHLWDCAIDYRPLYMPLKSVLAIGNLSLSSNIAARTKSSTFRFIAEDANLFISESSNKLSNLIDLKKDYVSVIELGLFELSLRLSDSVKCPKVDLKALINIVNIRTCSDSAKALAQLIKYFASYGDLNTPEPSKTPFPLNVPNSSHNIEGSLSESTVERVNYMMEDAMVDDRSDTNKSEQHSSTFDGPKDVDMFFFPDEGTPCDTAVPVDWCTSDIESEHDFCMLEHEAGSGIMPKSGMPEVRILASPVVVIDNYFNLAVGKADLLLPPKHYPSPIFRYTLQDMNLTWHMFGGCDFTPKKKNEKHIQIGESSSGVKKCVDTNIDNNIAERDFEITYEKRCFNDNIKMSPKIDKTNLSNKSMKWYTQGGTERNSNILMQLQLNKVKFQHEVYPDRTVQASRQVLLIHELEVRDRLSTSSINKFLYQFTSEASPRQSHANMVVVKAVHLRPDPRRNDQETCLKLSILPLRLNIDQDSLIFLINFFSQLSNSQSDGNEEVTHTSGNSHQVPVMSVEKESSAVKETQPSLLIMFDDEVNNTIKPPLTSNNESSKSPMYIRSFVFSPDVPIIIDYEGKRVDMTHGSLAGLLLGLGQLSCLQLKLKKITYRHGILGLDKLVSYVVSEWVQDMKKNQLPNLIGGVGPMHSLVQLFQGIRDLFWLPIEQYQKDGRIVRGLQRGANSFTTSTAIAALEITTRIVQAIQSVAETAFDMLSPGTSARRLHGKKGKRQSHYSRRPADIREGIANAYSLVKEGLGETAETIVRVASIEAEQKGAVGAVGGVLRQIPPTVVAPIILASAATSNLLGGVRSQLAPDARREESNKWRTEDNT